LQQQITEKIGNITTTGHLWKNMSRTTKQRCVLPRSTPKVTQNQPVVMCLGNNYPCILLLMGGLIRTAFIGTKSNALQPNLLKGSCKSQGNSL